MPASAPVDAILDRLEQASTAEALRAVLVEALADAGLPFVAYCHLSAFQKTGDVAALQIIMTFPAEWLEYYRARNYLAIDPVFQAARTARRPIPWAEVAARRDTFTARQRAILTEAAGAGLVDGLSIPLFGPEGDHAVVSVACPHTLAETSLNTTSLAAVTAVFHMLHQDLTQPPAAPDTPPHLHPREREVLQWCARGKTAWEISRILNLSERTVEHYAASARAKLQAPSRVSAVMQAARQGLISP